ncbi:MAG TPA: hypothetical protein VGR59_14215, partial [Gemmatimonadaceae bacterium]|nr:hypothetical protein [Gemmatimonadaceae bacterium]
TWHSEEPAQIDLPVHIEATVRGVPPFVAGVLSGGDATTDGFGFVRDAEMTNLAGGRIATLERDGTRAGYLFVSADAELWRATAPAAPGLGERRMFVVRTRGMSATIITVWNWSGHVSTVTCDGETLVVALEDGSVHSHRLENDEWHVAFEASGAQSSVALGGRAAAAARDERPPAKAPPAEALPVPTAPDEPLVFELGHDAYRQSEDSWVEAGAPSATVRVRVEDDQLAVAIDVRKSPVVFRAPDAVDPRLDNEDPDIHSDGVQLHIWTDATRAPLAWLVVPVESSSEVRIHVPDGARHDARLAASWRRTSLGYAMDLRLPVAALEAGGDGEIAMQVVVNDMAPGRQRRRGQLVVSGGAGEWVYLRGDREAAAHARRFRVKHG